MKPEITKMRLLSSVSKEDGFTYTSTLWCTFQRQRYEYVEVERDAKSGKARGELRRVDLSGGFTDFELLQKDRDWNGAG